MIIEESHFYSAFTDEMRVDKKILDTEIFIQQKWLEGFCPIVNGVIYGNGRIIICEFEEETHGGVRKVNFKKLCETNLEEALKGDYSYFTATTELCSKEQRELNKRISGGECGMGGDGFVSVINLADNRLDWVVFLDNSNPFIEVDCKEGSVIATSSYGDKWSFPIANPENAMIASCEI